MTASRSGELTAAEMEQRRQASYTHGLTSAAGSPAHAPAPLTLADRGELVRQAEQLYGIAAWLAHELHDAPVLSKAERLAMLYADIAGRANEAAGAIAAGQFGKRARAAQQRASSASERQGIERQATITAFLLGKTRGACAWLRSNGLTDGDGVLRPVLGFYGEYIERARRNALLLAAMLPVEDGEDVGAGKVLEALRGNQG